MGVPYTECQESENINSYRKLEEFKAENHLYDERFHTVYKENTCVFKVCLTENIFAVFTVLYSSRTDSRLQWLLMIFEVLIRKVCNACDCYPSYVDDIDSYKQGLEIRFMSNGEETLTKISWKLENFLNHTTNAHRKLGKAQLKLSALFYQGYLTIGYPIDVQ